MNIEQIILSFVQLADKIKELKGEEKENLLIRAKVENPWFVSEQTELALQGIQQFLQADKLKQWLQKYPVPTQNPQKIGVVMAGNIPAVGFHDFLSVLVSGHILNAKLSSQDTILMKQFAQWLIEIEPSWQERIFFVERLNDSDAYIATGSNNSARYFEYYFAKKPHIIRRNRNSIAVLNGQETTQDLENLGKDIFQYFGLGCRSISKLYVPQNYDLTDFFVANQAWEKIYTHNKYANNYDYSRSIYLMNQTSHFDNGFVLLKEDEKLASPIGVLYYQVYENAEALKEILNSQSTDIQLIASKDAWFPNSLPFGTAQSPELWDYADGVDTMEFLVGL